MSISINLATRRLDLNRSDVSCDLCFWGAAVKKFMPKGYTMRTATVENGKPTGVKIAHWSQTAKEKILRDFVEIGSESAAA